jgi:carbonic anhydrase
VRSTSFILITALILNTIRIQAWNYKSAGGDWENSCHTGLQSPINITGPFVYKKQNIEFFYKSALPEKLLNDGNNLVAEGDFGYIIYEGEKYSTNKAYFYSPSQITFAGTRYPLEMQLVHTNSNGNLLYLSILFKKTDSDSILLSKIGFNDNSLKDLQANEESQFVFENPIILGNYLNTKKDFLIYEGLADKPPCSNESVNFVITDILKASQTQLENYPVLLKKMSRKVQPRLNRIIFSTFEKKDIKKKIENVYDIIEEEEIFQEATKATIPIIKPEKNITATINATNTKSKDKIRKETEKKLEKFKNLTNLDLSLNTTQDLVDLDNAINDLLTQCEKNQIYTKLEAKAFTSDMKNGAVGKIRKAIKVMKEKLRKEIEYKRIIEPKIIDPTTVDQILDDQNAINTLVIDKDFPTNSLQDRLNHLETKYEKMSNFLKDSMKDKDKPKQDIKKEVIEKEDKQKDEVVKEDVQDKQNEVKHVDGKNETSLLQINSKNEKNHEINQKENHGPKLTSFLQLESRENTILDPLRNINSSVNNSNRLKTVEIDYPSEFNNLREKYASNV